MTSTVHCRCPKCGTEGEMQTYPSVNSSEDPSLRLKVLDGSAMAWTCPCCGHVQYRQYELLYHDPQSKFMIWMIPGGKMDVTLEQYGKRLYSMLPEYVCRKVDNPLRLAEKIQILEQGASDVVMELAKLVIKHEMMDKAGGDEHRMQEIFSSNVFCHGFRMEGVECVELTFSMVNTDGSHSYMSVAPRIYNDAAGIVARNPEFTAPKGFASVDFEWILTKVK